MEKCNNTNFDFFFFMISYFFIEVTIENKIKINKKKLKICEFYFQKIVALYCNSRLKKKSQKP